MSNTYCFKIEQSFWNNSLPCLHTVPDKNSWEENSFETTVTQMEGYVFGFRPFLIIIGNDVNSLTSAIRGHLPTTFRKCWIIIIGTQTKKHKFHLSLGGLNWTFSDWFVDHLSGPGQHYLTSHYPGDHYPDHTRAPRSLSQIIVTRDDRDHNDTRVNIAETMTLCHHETWDRVPSSNIWPSSVQLSTAFIDIWNLIPSCFEILASSLTIQNIHFLLYDWKKAC